MLADVRSTRCQAPDRTRGQLVTLTNICRHPGVTLSAATQKLNPCFSPPPRLGQIMQLK